ncbi:MAG: hypothetical protein EAX91_02340 [Candidatus Lokiarchaeota archaeon]|nr:hypothetical protein [Candidatus Lokiarchaeota archaeon]
MILYENNSARLLNIIKWGNNPFKKFVSTSEIKEELDFVKSREGLINRIKTIVKEDRNFILPVIGEVGSGKTHLYWALKNSLYYYNTFYISLESVYKKFFYNIYSEFIEKLEIAPLKFVVNQLCENWGALERKYGFFQVVDIEKIKKTAINQLSAKYSEIEPEILKDAITGITTHQLDPYKKIEAERWLLGKLLDAKELSILNITHDLHKGKNAYVLLRLFIENSKLGTILFIDDFEKIVGISNPQDDLVEEVFDPSWLYGAERSPNDIASEKIFSKITQLQNIDGLRVIITLKSIDSLEQIKKKYQDIDSELLPPIKEPIFLENFSEEDIFELYKSTMRNFFNNIECNEFTKEFENNYFPLNSTILKNVFRQAHGNPRVIIKTLIRIFNEIIEDEEDLETILKNYENLTTN